MRGPASSRQKLRKFGFQKGRENPNKGKNSTPSISPCSKVEHKYVRLNKESFNARVDTTDGTLTFTDVDGTPTNVSPLRPRSKQNRLIDDFSIPDETNVHPDLLTNRLYCPKLVQEMFNSEIRKHCISDGCSGELNFDVEASRKWGLAWSERLKCTKCQYVSSFYKLYTEVESKSRGRKAAGVNVGFQLGLMTTAISNAGASRILANSDIAPPSQKSMQYLSNKVGSCIEKLNLENMREVRQSLKDENEKCGLRFSSAVRTESDSCYNNPLFNAENTPFQAGTIVTTTVCENNTRNKRILGVHVGTKLCPRASMLRNRGKTVECPNHSGHCTANLKESDSIGNESKWNEIISRDIKQDLDIVCHTSDGDSKSHIGIERGQNKPVLPLKDIRHLSNSMRREINKAPFSTTMFAGRNKSNLKSRFALSVKSRCVAELRKAHSVYNKDIPLMKAKMPNVVSAILLCFRGYCGHMCSKYSLVCPGHGKYAFSYLPPHTKLKMAGSDVDILKKCIEILLGEENLNKTRFGTSTQKCEAVNRAYHACMPKNVTFPRNCHGRIHGQVLRINHGHADSTILKGKALKIVLNKGSAVMRHLRKIDDRERRRKSKKYVLQAKMSRYALRKHRYQTHAEVHYQKGISDPKLDLTKIPYKDHDYV